MIGLDEGDRRSLEKFYRGSDPPCQLDPEDNRFVLKGQYQMSMYVYAITVFFGKNKYTAKGHFI